MLLWTIFRVAIASLLSNKLRSVLSMLGIIIGVGAVISMLAVGEGAQKKVLDRVTSMGADLLIVRPGSRGHRGVRGAPVETLVVEDADAILKEIPQVKQLSPVVKKTAQFKYFNRNAPSTLLGVAPTYFGVRNFEVETGRAFTDGDVERMARVVCIGTEVVKNLFEDEDPLGKTIKIGAVRFEVIGVLKAKGDQGWYNPDDQALAPFTTVCRRLYGKDNLREIDIQMLPGSDQKEVEEAVGTLLRKRHRIRPKADDDFYVRNVAEMADAAQAMTRTFTVLLGAVAAISLLVGGIGIMNIMLVTVTERTREIGIRKAIGATNWDVMVQFLLESFVMSVLGGGLGVALGVGGATLFAHLADFPTVIKSSAVILALAVSAGVGVFFGFYPARRAAALDPIECLRYE